MPQRHPEVGFRLAGDDDVRFIFKRMLQDLRLAPTFYGVGNDLFYRYMHRAFEAILTRCPVTVAHALPIATAAGTFDRSAKKILGFIIADPTEIGLVIHYMNVRRSFDDVGNETENYRCQGIATKLIEQMWSEYQIPKQIKYTIKPAMFQRDPAFKDRVERDRRIEYNPFLFYTLLRKGWEEGIRRPSEQRYSNIGAY